MDFSNYLRVEPHADKLCEKIDYLTTEGLSEYDTLARSTLETQSWPSLTDNAIVETGFSAGEADLQRRIRKSNYYVSNCLCFTKVIRPLVTTETKDLLDGHSDDPILAQNYCKLFGDLLFDSIELLNRYAVMVKGANPIYPIVRSPLVEILPLWHFTRQLAFGQVSGHAFADREPEMTIAAIRLIIEVRLRRATGILKKKRVSDPTLKAPVNLSRIIDSVKRHSDEITLAVPIQNINRIYKWSNEFVHSGTRDHTWSWLPLYALEYLKPFLIGVMSGNTLSANNGFECSSATLAAIRDSVLQAENATSRSRNLLQRLVDVILRRRQNPLWNLDLSDEVDAIIT